MSTPEQIKQYLLHNHPASVEQLSRALDLTKADIHYHIRQLLDRGEITIHHVPMRYTGPGRPARQYLLVESVPIATSRLVLSGLLAEFLGNDPAAEQLQAAAEKIAQTLLSCCPSSRNLILSPAIRLNQITRELAPLGIRMSWEAGKKGPVIRINQEPFSTLFQDKSMVDRILESLILLIKKEIA